MTAQDEMTFSGVGLFSARPSTVSIRLVGPGIMLVQSASGRDVEIPAAITNVRPARGPLGGRSTNLEAGGARVSTVEHLLSALAGLGIWKARARVSDEEVPIGDGSAIPFVGAIESLRPARDAEPVRLRGVVRVEDAANDAWIEARPAAGPHPRYRFELSYPAGSGIPDQAFEWNGSRETYIREIAPARTYCLESEAIAMRGAGLFRHLTPRDMLVIAPSGDPIDNTFRFPDEPVRHKLLDLIGDLALLGGPLIADVVAHKSSHALTHELCRRIAAERSTLVH